jgi:hypothetical protein
MDCTNIKSKSLFRRLNQSSLAAVVLLLGLGTLASTTGCVSLAANMLRVVRGYDFPPEFSDLAEHRVAVVCMTETGICADASSILLSRYVREILDSKVKEIDSVSQEDIDQWLEDRGWEDHDYVEIAKGVKADRIVAIQMTNLKLKDSSTLYQGRADIVVTVFDTAKGTSPVFRKNLEDFTFPKMSGFPSPDNDDAKFRRAYLAQVAKTVARLFHGYDMGTNVANDTDMLSY